CVSRGEAMPPGHTAEKERDLLDFEKAFLDNRVELLRHLRLRLSSELHARVDAEEVVQKVYLRAREARERYAESGLAFPAWLRWIASDVLFDERDWNIRKRRDVRKDVRFPDNSSAQFGLGLFAVSTTPSGVQIRKELQEQVRRVLKDLDPDDRDILCLHVFDD